MLTQILIRYQYILEQKTDFLSHFWLTSTRHHVKCGCLGDKERPIFLILVLKDFLFISKKSHKASRKKSFAVWSYLPKATGKGGGGNSSYPSPTRVNFGYVPEYPKMEVSFPPSPHIMRFIFLSYALTSKFF